VEGKICLVSGIGAGIGREAAHLLSAEGGVVVGCDINLQAAEETAEHIRSNGGRIEVFPKAADLTDFPTSQAYVAFAEETFSGVDVVFNNAARIAVGFMDEMTPKIWDDCIKGELDIAFYLCLAVWPAMIRRGGGSIVNVGSVRGQKPSPNMGNVAHMAAKAGVIAMSQQMALEGGRHGIRVNSVSPGQINTPQGKPFTGDPVFMRATAPLRVLGRQGEPRDIANYVLFLASDESAYITGTDLLIDGGSFIASTASIRFTPQSMPG
jgi:NAD(P)-dependent dehydrogenase (short-subunit alcohol dehydrogenase family)